jgi:2-dehydropantoate 2-reductase
MEVVVFGAGSLGSLVGARLAREHDVTLVGRAAHVRAVRESGLAVEGVESFQVWPAATTSLADVDADLAVVTVKAFDTAAAATALADAAVGAVLSLQNGLGNEATLADRLSVPVVAGTTTVGARLEAPGRVAWLGRGETTVGPWTDDAEQAAADVAAAFRAAAVPCDGVSGPAVRAALWEKLGVNAAVNPLTALAGVANGAVAAPPLAGLARTAAAETGRVARAQGVDVDPGAMADQAIAVAQATAENHSSMRQDVDAGRRTEVDAINGHVVAEAESARVSVPVNATLAKLVAAWEQGQGHRDRSDGPSGRGLAGAPDSTG